jgi:5,10-methylenetetrahydromethanopterin reductase
VSVAGERIGLGISNCRKAQDVINGVKRAEELGAEIAFVAEDVNCRDAFELCALASAATERIKISPGVVNPYTRNPTSLAMAVATLDEASGGRAMLGLGTSSPSLIEEQMGIPVGNGVGVMREATEIIRRLLIGDSVTYEGKHFRYRNAALAFPPVQRRIPIFFAAMGPLMLRLAGRLADGVLLNVGASTDYVRWAVGEIRAGAASVGRSPDEITVAAWLTVYVTDDYASGLQSAREWLATMLSIPRQGELLLGKAGFDLSILERIRSHVGGYPHTGDREVASEYVPEEVAEKLTLIGNIGRVSERLGEYRDSGVGLPVLGLSALRALVESVPSKDCASKR